MDALRRLGIRANDNYDGDLQTMVQNALAQPSSENVGALVVLHKHNIINLNKAALREYPRSSNETGSHPINALELYSEQARGSDSADSELNQATHSAVINQLKQAGISVQGSKNSPNTPLHMALSSTHHNPSLAKALLRCGADPFAKGSQGVSALRLAAQTGQDQLLPIMLATKDSSQWPMEVFDAALASDSKVLFKKIIDNLPSGTYRPDQRAFSQKLLKHIQQHGVAGIGPNGFSFITTKDHLELSISVGDDVHASYSSFLECALGHAIDKDDDHTLRLLKSHMLQSDNFQKIVTFHKAFYVGPGALGFPTVTVSNPIDQFFNSLIEKGIKYHSVKCLKILLEKETHDGIRFDSLKYLKILLEMQTHEEIKFGSVKYLEILVEKEKLLRKTQEWR
jgi:ankyrin repeat protein